MKQRMVLIRWVDSCGVTDEWERVDELRPQPPAKCLSVGFLLEESRYYVTIAQSVSGRRKPRQVLGRMTIPKCAITRVKELKP